MNILKLIGELLILFSAIILPIIGICLFIIKVSEILSDYEIKKWVNEIFPNIKYK